MMELAHLERGDEKRFVVWEPGDAPRGQKVPGQVHPARFGGIDFADVKARLIRIGESRAVRRDHRVADHVRRWTGGKSPRRRGRRREESLRAGRSSRE